MAETAITTVLSKFGELATREATVLLQVSDDVNLLRDRLDWLQAFIRDADRKRRAGTDRLTLVWLRQTREVTFEAEDTLDYLFLKVDLESKGYGRWRTWQIYLIGWWSQLISGHWLSYKIKHIEKRLDNISENQTKNKINLTPSTIWRPSTTSCAHWDDQDDLGVADGHGEEVHALQEMLNEEVGTKFISVLGESGSGKSTLVSHFYRTRKESDVVNGEDKKELPGVFVWYNMPPGSSTEDLLKQVHDRILKRVGARNRDSPEVKATDDVAARIRDLLEGKTYMLVLSGISSVTMLNCVSASLPGDNNGSGVVVLILEPDAHGVEVARRADALNGNRVQVQKSIIWLTRWTQDRTLAVFHKMITNPHRKGASSSKPENKDNDGHSKADNSKANKIVYDITGGHPLAIAVLAGLVRHRESDLEQKAVLELEELKPPCPIDKIFAASYDDLRQDLKSCFLYFAAYSKNISHPADQIVRMWVAEGFINPRDGRTPEELGHMYLEELVSRRLVRRLGKKQFIVHSRLLEFLQSEARHASFVEVHTRNDVLAPASVRRLSVQDDGYGYTPFTTKFPKLRTFICRVEQEEDDDGNGGQGSTDTSLQTTGTKSWWSSMVSCLEGVIPWLDTEGGRRQRHDHDHHDLKFLRWSKFLRLISVQGLHLKELPDEIGDMIHLRYLRVDSKELQKLPRSIGRLVNLQTLDIRNTQVKEIDGEFWTIRTLRHVFAESLELPATLEEEMGDLQTLHGVRPGQGESWNERESPLHKMAKLQSLELRGLESKKHGAAMANALGNMHLLGHLKLQGDEISACCIFTEQSLRCLQTVELHGTVRWEEVPEGFVIRHVRPNLTKLGLPSNDEAPLHIQNQLKAYVHNIYFM